MNVNMKKFAKERSIEFLNKFKEITNALFVLRYEGLSYEDIVKVDEPISVENLDSNSQFVFCLNAYSECVIDLLDFCPNQSVESIKFYIGDALGGVEQAIRLRMDIEDHAKLVEERKVLDEKIKTLEQKLAVD